MILTWMPDALRNAGLKVIELGGWNLAGHGAMGDILGVLGHHTAGPTTGNNPSLGVVVKGRSDLAGPLCNLYLDRAGTWYTIAAGAGWHAGTGSLPWCPRDQGNQHLIGIEAESAGTGDWTAAQFTSYPQGVAALLRHLSLPAARFAGHLEYAPTRKVDPAGWPGGMNGFRSSVTGYLTPAPPAPEQHPTEESMYLRCGNQVAILSGGVRIPLTSPGELKSAADAMGPQKAVTQWVETATWESIPTVKTGA